MDYSLKQVFFRTPLADFIATEEVRSDSVAQVTGKVKVLESQGRGKSLSQAKKKKKRGAAVHLCLPKLSFSGGTHITSPARAAPGAQPASRLL